MKPQRFTSLPLERLLKALANHSYSDYCFYLGVATERGVLMGSLDEVFRLVHASGAFDAPLQNSASRDFWNEEEWGF